MPNVYDTVAAMTRGETPPRVAGEGAALMANLEETTALADYVWLPIRFDGDRPVIGWHDEWRIEDYD